MKEVCLDDFGYPPVFFKMLGKSVQIYFHSLLSYIILSLLIYSPLFFLELLRDPRIVFLFEMFHGGFLDILVFLTLPTLLVYNKVYPLGTIRIFLQRFFASAVIITIIQLFLYSFGVFGIIPYIFIVFAGFFLVIENSPEIFNVKRSLFQSTQLTKVFFLSITRNLILIVVFAGMPISVFAILYFSDHQGLIRAFQSLEEAQEVGEISIAQLVDVTMPFTKESEFRFGWVCLHILVRPLKAIFMAVMFITLMQQVDPIRIKQYLSIHSPESPSDSTTETS